jgi:BirA family biotin operon repressor/biotin-[acetyl-CoA-carboxylase] ligase
VTISFGEPHEHHSQVDSTNERAKELAAGGAAGGLVVTAHEQTAGRGRQGRQWFSPPGGALLYSALLRPLGDRPLLPLAAPVAVAEAAEGLAQVECALKWPNDVWIDGRKLAGILIEGRPEEDWAVIGIGLNIDIPEGSFPAELRSTATSLSGVSFADALAAVNGALGRWVEEGPERVLAEFRRRDALAGRRISWADGVGVAGGVDDAGHLLVRANSGERLALGAGEVHLEVGPPEV